MREVYNEYSYFFQKCRISQEALSSFNDKEVEYLGDVLKEYSVYRYRTSPKEFILSWVFDDVPQGTKEKYLTLF